MNHQGLVFASVFPVPSLSHTTPTPIATPNLGHSAFGQSFGGSFVGSAGGQHRDVRRNLAWSTATRFLSLPKSRFAIDDPLGTQRVDRSSDVEDALEYLLVGEGQSEDGHEESLMQWYANEATLHFANLVRPSLTQLWEEVYSRFQGAGMSKY
jgi:anaphase-promoting complex subunit 2